MPYDENFYKLYKNYLKEPVVRKNHDFVFGCFKKLAGRSNLSIIDLGCGLGEYQTRGQYTDYVGIDLNNTGKIRNFVSADYHKLNFAKKLPFKPNAFVSLFSIECCNPAKEKYTLYNKIFKAMPSIKYGLVGGFFYESKRNQEAVEEAGENISYQTIEDPSCYISRVFNELRLHIYTPSTMFGQDVVEVWKIFMRV